MTDEELREARQRLWYASAEFMCHIGDGPGLRRAEHALLDAAAPLLKERARLVGEMLEDRKGGD